MIENRKLAGLVLFLGAIIYILGTVIGDKYGNTMIFNVSVLLLGFLMIVGAYFIQLTYNNPLFSILIAFAGIGTAGLGVLEQDSMIYFTFAAIGYVAFALSAILSSKYEKSPMGIISIILGVFTLFALVLWISGIELSPGITITPIIADYPVLLWLVGFGAYILGEASNT